MVETNENIAAMSAREAWTVLYGKELNTKKNILEYIEIVKVLKQQEVPEDKVQETYNFIYNSIEGLGPDVKVNTKMYLKNQLKAQLGKLVKDKDPKPVNHFIEFFKEAYPPNQRRKDFTWVLMDISKISDEQGWTTLAYIHSWLLQEGNGLSGEQKRDIIKIVELLVKRKNVKLINNLRSLENLLSNLNIKIVTVENGFRVKSRQ